MLKFRPLVSIVIPVYNSEKTLHRTLDSLTVQTYSHLELIFINDASTDSSLKIIDEFSANNSSKLFSKITVITHSTNQGVAAARNTGLGQAKGDYIYFFDADDYIEPFAMEVFVNKAVETNADIVGCNWYLSFEKNERKMIQPSFINSEQALEMMVEGRMRWNLWLFFVRKSLYIEKNIRFIPGMNVGEDMMVMIKLFTYAGGIAYVDQALYHYGQSNEHSISKVFSDRHLLELTHNVNEVENFLKRSKYSHRAADWVNDLKLTIKFPLLISSEARKYAIWRNWYAEVNEMGMQSKSTPLRIRILQWAAQNKQDWIIKIHYYLIIKIVYGVIYK